MTQTIKDRIEELKIKVDTTNDGNFTEIKSGLVSFNAGVDACLPLLEEVLQTRICNRKGTHTCRAGAFHLPERFNGTIEDILKLTC